MWRHAIAALTLAFGGLGLATLLSPDGAPPDSWSRVAVVALSVSTLPVAMIIARTPLGPGWWLKRAPRKINLVFVAYADIGLSIVVLTYRNVEGAFLLTGLFAVVGAYVSQFVPARVMAAHIAFSSAVILTQGARLVVAGRDLPTVAVAVIAAVVVANGVVCPMRRYTAETQRLMRHQLVESSLDPLTKLMNRRGFTMWSKVLIRDAHAEVLIAAIDVDSFKSINDRFGHAVGDSVLTNVARVLSEGMTSDAVVARRGGDEFAVISAEPDADEEFLNRLIHLDPIRLPDGSTVSLSVGIVRIARVRDRIASHGTSALLERGLDEADLALKASKVAGRGRTTTLGRADDVLRDARHDAGAGPAPPIGLEPTLGGV